MVWFISYSLLTHFLTLESTYSPLLQKQSLSQPSLFIQSKCIFENNAFYCVDIFAILGLFYSKGFMYMYVVLLVYASMSKENA